MDEATGLILSQPGANTKSPPARFHAPVRTGDRLIGRRLKLFNDQSEIANASGRTR